jgi:hypothetical protein
MLVDHNRTSPLFTQSESITISGVDALGKGQTHYWSCPTSNIIADAFQNFDFNPRVKSPKTSTSVPAPKTSRSAAVASAAAWNVVAALAAIVAAAI